MHVRRAHNALQDAWAGAAVLARVPDAFCTAFTRADWEEQGVARLQVSYPQLQYTGV